MAKVHKLEIYLIDANGDYDHFEEKQLKEYVEESLQIKLDVNAKVTEIKSSDEFEWDDDLHINQRYATKEDYERHLK